MNLSTPSRRRRVRVLVLAAVSFALLFMGGNKAALNAASPLVVRTVPWDGLPGAGHQVYSGGSLILQGVATSGVTDTPAPGLVSAKWDPGDGTPVVSVPLGNPLALELTHVYAGADGTPFTATLTVTDSTATTATATFRVVVKTKTLDVERNMAIDKGLWYLWKNHSNTTVGAAVPAAFWSFGGTSAATASAVQAFEINNHKESGVAAQDPYVHLAARGLAWLESIMQQQAIGAQPAGNPDTLANGIGIYFNDNSSNYLVGQVVDAFVASGTPNATAVTGPAFVIGRKYRDLVQDMMDFSYWGQNDPACGSSRGSWYYGPNACAPDNSTSQWPAIGGIAAARVWGITPPPFVLSENLFWMHTSQFLGGGVNDGQFGYTSSSCLWSACQATTPSGLVQYIYDGVGYNHAPGDPAPAPGTDSERFLRGVRHVARMMRTYNDWPGGALAGSGSDPSFGGQNYYAMYATRKALTLALDGSGHPSPIDLIDDDPAAGLPAFDYYRSDPGAGGAGIQPYGMARGIIANQQADGHWNGAGQWTNPLSTDYAIIILSPSLFELGPKASCQATPNEIGSFGGDVSFTSTGTIEQNPDPTVHITTYAWHFDDGSADVTGAADSTSHHYAGGPPAAFTATLTVTDSNGNHDTTSCPVNRVDTNVKPTAKAGSNLTPPIDGEYLFCKGTTLVLDGSGSTDPEDGTVTSYAWDVTAPLTFTPPDSTSALFDASAIFQARAPGVYDIGLKVADLLGKTDSKFGHVTVKDATDPACNQPPVANPDTFSTNEDTTLNANVRTNDTDDHGIASTTVILVTGASHGVLALNGDGSFSYTPAANYNGPDSFSYKLNDGQYDSNVATVSITVNSVDDAPIASDDAVTTNEDTPVSDNVLGNDSDVDNPVGMLTAAIVTPPAHGVVSLAADGSFTYTPDADFNGADSFTYQASDGEAVSNTATVHITVNPVNDAPQARDDSAALDEDTSVTGNVLANDSDVDGDTLSASLGSGPAHGTLALNPNGSFTYTPTHDYCGPDGFTYTANDGHGGSTPASVSITVNCVNDAPVANNDSATTSEDTAVSGNVLVNDSDADGDALSASLQTNVSHGTLSLNPDGSFTYAPAANYCGPDGFGYAASDGHGGSTPASVTLAVTCVNDAPVANDDSASTDEDTAVAGNVLTNDTDIDSSVTAVLGSGPANGTVSLNSDGSFVYTPNGNFFGTDSFTYAATDGEFSDTATVTITVASVNDAPVANNDSATTAEDTPVSGNVLANDTDLDGDTLTASLGTSVSHGTLTLNGNGSFTYAPAANYCGADSFSYTVSDGHGGSAPASVSITVTCVNDAPVANNDSAVTNEDTPVAGNVLTNDSDVDGDALTAALVTNVSHGTLVLNANGTYTYAPAPNYNGPDSFTYQVSDGHGGTAVATVSITVVPVNDAPVCSAVTGSISEIWPPNHQMVPVNFSGATDTEGDALAYKVVAIYQDEPTNTVGDGNTPSDAAGVGTGTALVRAERSGTPRVPGNGRVYHILVTAVDGSGASCDPKDITVGVPHDQGNSSVLIDDGIKFNSVTGAAVP